jgi:tetratricopeptide (TPR) repeat protein
MKVFSVCLTIGCFLIMLSGCTAYKHHKAGDAAAETGDMRAAVYHYERALANKDRYGRDADFLNKLAVAKSRVAYDDARRLRNEGRYEPAIDKLREAMRLDPSYAEPAEVLPAVLKEAARWRYAQALAAADAGDLDAARDHLTRSMRHDLTNEASAYAMRSLSPETLPADTPGLDTYRSGLTQAAQRRWALAEQTQAQAVAANGGLLPARAALHEARAALAESRALQQQGQAAIERVTMGPAIDALERSLAVWPFNDEATASLAYATTQKALADAQLTKATAAASDAKWDDAIALSDSGLSIDRSHVGLAELRDALPRRAAKDHTRRGDDHLEAGDLDAAHRAYARALSYRDSHREARLGMGYVYNAWAQNFEKADRFGAALLNYAKGQSYTRSKTLDDGVVRMGAAIRDRLGVGLAVSANERNRGAIDPRQLSGALVGTLQSKRSLGLEVRSQNTPYELRLSIDRAEIDERLTNTVRRQHRYTTTELRRNHEYDRVSNRLCSEEARLHRLEAQLSSIRCRGHHNGGACDCFTGSHYRHLHNQVDRQRHTVRRLRRELSRTPRQIEVIRNHQWPYTVETFTKTGKLSVVTELIDTASGKPVKAFTHQASYAQTDSRTLNANPGIGLREDHLRLRDDAYVADALTRELALSAGPWAVNAVVDHRLAQIASSIEALDAAGRVAEALEARVDSAVLIAIVDPEGSQRSLDKLTKSHTR